MRIDFHFAAAYAIARVAYPFNDGFLASDYRRFHDAAEEQRFAVFKKILPRFGSFEA